MENTIKKNMVKCNANLNLAEGLVLYSIENDNCLNGVYTNENTRIAGTIYNEIAKKVVDQTANNNSIAGTYQCVYFDEEGQTFEMERVNLKIVPIEGNMFQFIWEKDTIQRFIGVGYQMNSFQIAVHYWSAQS